MKRGTPDHPKTMALMRELGVSKPTAVGLLELLWHFTARFAPRGDIGRFSNEAIAAAIGWDGDPDKMLAALVRCGWLDEHPEHRLVVHDWSEHADGAVRLWLAKRKLTFADGAAPYQASQERKAMAHTHGPCGTASTHGPSQQTDTGQTHGPCDGPYARAVDPIHSRSQNPEPLPEPEAGSQKPVPTAAGARRAGNGTAGLPWLAAIDTALADVVGRPPRPGTAVKLASAAASFGIHPRFVARWIVERNGSPPKSDGLFLSIVESDLVPWVRRQQYPSEYRPTEQARCQRCGGVITAFRDAIVPCGCDQPAAPRERPEP